MRTSFKGIAVATALLALVSVSATIAAPTSSDKTFLSAAVQGNMTEVALGKLASQKGSSAAIKAAGQKMVTDHTKVFDQLKDVARKENVAVPSAMSKAQQADYDKLNKQSGADFDKAYTKAMVDAHKKDIAAFQKEQKNTKDTSIKAIVDGALPVMQGHLTMFSGMKM